MREGHTGQQRLTLSLNDTITTEIPIQLINDLPIRVYVKDENGKFIWANQACSDALAGIGNSLIGKEDKDFFETTLAAEWRKEESRLLSTGEHVLNKHEQETFVSGRTRWVLTSKFPVPSSTGPAHILGITIDATDHKMEERQKDILLDQIPDLVYSKRYNPSTDSFRFTYVNAAVAQAFGVPKSEIIGEKDERYIDDPALARLLKIDKKVMETGRRQSYEEEIPISAAADGRPQKLLKLSTVKVPLLDLTQPHSPCVGVLGVSSHFDDLRRVTQDLNLTKQALASLIEEAPVGVFIKNTNGEFVDVNRELVRLVGKQDKLDVLGKTDADFFAAEYAQESRDDENTLLVEKKATQHLRLTKLLLNNSTSQRYVTKVPLLDHKGDVTGILGISQDATEIFGRYDFIRKVADAVPEALYVVNSDGQYVFVNKRFATCFSMQSPEEIVYNRFTAHQIFEPDIATRMERLHQQTLKSESGNTAGPAIIRFAAEDGKVFFFEVNPISIADDRTGERYVIGLLDDRSVESSSPPLHWTAATIRDEMWKKIGNMNRTYYLLCLFLTHRHGIGLNRVTLWEYNNTTLMITGITGVGQLTREEIEQISEATHPLELVSLFDCIANYDAGRGEASKLPEFVNNRVVTLNRSAGLERILRSFDRKNPSTHLVDLDPDCPLSSQILTNMEVGNKYAVIIFPCAERVFVVVADNNRVPEGRIAALKDDQMSHFVSVTKALDEILRQVAGTNRGPKTTNVREQFLQTLHFYKGHFDGILKYLDKEPCIHDRAEILKQYLRDDINYLENTLNRLATEAEFRVAENNNVCAISEVVTIIEREYQFRHHDLRVEEHSLEEVNIHFDRELTLRVATELAENTSKHVSQTGAVIWLNIAMVNYSAVSAAMRRKGYSMPNGAGQPNFVQIRIRDDGQGIPSESKLELFDHLPDSTRERHAIGLISAMQCMLGQYGWIEEIGKSGAEFALYFRCAKIRS
jgi:PAS domain S-box-containing protein